MKATERKATGTKKKATKRELIDTGSDQPFVRRQVTCQILIPAEHAKSGRARPIPFQRNGRLAEVLERRRSLGPDPYIFGTPTGAPQQEFRTAGRPWCSQSRARMRLARPLMAGSTVRPFGS